MQPARQLAQWSIFVFVFALFFWVWAIVNTATKGMGMDLGVISFLTVMVSNGYMYHATCHGQASTRLGNDTTRITIMLTYGLVILNYILGLVIGIHLGMTKFSVYCGVFVFLWASLAYRTSDLIGKAVSNYEPLLGN